MANSRSMAWGAVVLAATMSAGHAGPCSPEIDRMQARIDAALEAKAGAGAAAKESSGALTHRQPTPGSIAAAEEGTDKLSTEKVDAVTQAMARARVADGAGDKGACEQALADAQQVIGP